MKKRYYILLLAALLLALCYFLSQCSSVLGWRTENEEETILVYYKENRDLLREIAKECLRVAGTGEVPRSVQISLESLKMSAFTDDRSEPLDPAEGEPLSTLVATLRDEDAPFTKIVTSDLMHYLEGRTCSFYDTIFVHGEPYYHFELIYCEEPNATIRFADITLQLDPHWYLIGYKYY